MAAQPPSIPADDAPPPLTGLRLYVASIAVSLGFFLALLDVTVANVSVPHIAGALSVSPAQGTWIITAYAVAEAICMPLTGWLSGRFGALRTYVTALTGFMIASALCGMSVSLPMLVICRVLQGACSAPLLPLCQVLLMRVWPRAKMNTTIAIPAMTAVLAPVLGPIIGGTITDNISWRWIFYLNIPFVLISIPVIIRLFAPYETKSVPSRVDVIGLVLLILWVGALQLMLDLGREYDWFNSTLITVLAITAVVGFAAFLIWELTEEAPIVNLRILRHRGFWTSCLCMSVGYAALMSTSVMVALWVQTTMGYTATDAGWVIAPMSMFSLVMIPLAGAFVARFDARIMICFGLFWLGSVMLLRAHSPPDLAMWQIALPQGLQGVSNALFMFGLSVVGLAAVRSDEMAAATGLMSFLRTIATAAGISGATTIWDAEGRTTRADLSGLLNGAGETIDRMISLGLTDMQARSMIESIVDAQSRTIAYNHIFMLMAALSMFAGLLVWLIPRPAKRGAGAGAAAAGH